MMRLSIFLLFLLSAVSEADVNTERWISDERSIASEMLINAIHPQGSSPGSVMASPSQANPDYYYNWIRDAALVIREFQILVGVSSQPVIDYASFSRVLQLTNNRSGGVGDTGLGEPKFEMSGAPFNGDWARPQNDGPALRASTLIMTARDLLKSGDSSLLGSLFYSDEVPAQTVIKADLEFTAHHWQDPCKNLWEEGDNGEHFYTRLAQERAMEDGQSFAKEMADLGASDFYSQQEKLIQQNLETFYSQDLGYVVATLGTNRLDVSVLLGVLHSGPEIGSFSVLDSRIMATAQSLEDAFRNEYPINKMTLNEDGLSLGVAFGRYPGDTYDGTAGGRTGNPWFLATQGAAEYYFRFAIELLRVGQINVDSTNLKFFQELSLDNPIVVGTQFIAGTPEFERLVAASEEKAMQLVRRVREHTGTDGHQSEQFNRDTGFVQGARDLSWSYASFLSMARAHDELALIQLKRKRH